MPSPEISDASSHGRAAEIKDNRKMKNLEDNRRGPQVKIEKCQNKLSYNEIRAHSRGSKKGMIFKPKDSLGIKMGPNAGHTDDGLTAQNKRPKKGERDTLEGGNVVVGRWGLSGINELLAIRKQHPLSALWSIPVGGES